MSILGIRRTRWIRESKVEECRLIGRASFRKVRHVDLSTLTDKSTSNVVEFRLLELSDILANTIERAHPVRLAIFER